MNMVVLDDIAVTFMMRRQFLKSEPAENGGSNEVNRTLQTGLQQPVLKIWVIDLFLFVLFFPMVLLYRMS